MLWEHRPQIQVSWAVVNEPGITMRCGRGGWWSRCRGLKITGSLAGRGRATRNEAGIQVASWGAVRHNAWLTTNKLPK